MDSGTGRAHGKAILLGEHAVVYGAPALAVPIPFLTATARATRVPCPDDGGEGISFTIAGPGPAASAPLPGDGTRQMLAEFREATGFSDDLCVDVVVDCAVPQGRGLGSSAACARAAVLALADLCGFGLDAATVFRLVQASENVAHGRASGIDAVATGSDSPVLFRSGVVQELSTNFEGRFVIADSGVGGSTKEAVELVRRRFEHDAQAKEEFVSRASGLTGGAVRDLEQGDLAGLGARLTENHVLLQELGLSTDRIDRLVAAALMAGSPGAKISGGGLGGCVIALAGGPGAAEELGRTLREAGATRTWIVPMRRLASHVD
ncbi:mevalonate kinase [Actinocorallia sp. API 0066]|uniref:mevalonate kinase n=1 Tax=Actinocorallia sp. API 0066 TaxID=2896846 RepID=UPI001E2F41E3|nr:mevalonate kinase [Actinocorallia sp. API 0066]MCD0448645.1 mevalonate kinase [Actinocorallia sp. API 0066]